MIEKVKETIKKYNLIDKDDKILVGVSGGPDSIALVTILHKLGYNLCVAHINHGLRENAILDEEYVLEYCKKINIPCFIKKANLNENSENMSIEEAGRKIRYDFFNEILMQENCTKIATAHNSNDNAETIIMNMIRGSGLSGLKGIEPKRNNIIRPLIKISRKEIIKYCEENQITPRHDESNDETIFTRNKVRLELIPYIEKNINSNVINNINRMSEIISDEEKFISNQTEKAYKEIILKETNEKLVCNLKIFNKLDIVLKRRIILKLIIKILGNAKDIEKVHVDDIVKLCENNVGGKYLTPNKNIKLLIIKGKLEVEKIEQKWKGGSNEKNI